MVKTESTMLPLGTRAPEFRLPDTGGEVVSLEDFQGADALLVAFLSNHCPYVKHIRRPLVEFACEYGERGLATVAINSNDTERYPDDSPERMRSVKDEVGFVFPYLFDESQDVAKAYNAACTPDFFLFDDELELAYRGRFDASRPGNNVPVTGEDLRAAVDAVLDGRPPAGEQIPSMGCNIKWKPGNAPAA